MAHSAQITDRPLIAALSARSFVRAIKIWLRYRKNLREIAALDDRTLRDIGMNRVELVGQVWRDACGERCIRGGF